MTRIYISRAVVEAVALAACAGLIAWQVTLNKHILGAMTPYILLSATFTGAAFFLAWIIRGAHKSNLDTAIHEKGPLEREVFRAYLTEYNEPNQQFSVQEFIDAKNNSE